MMCSKKSIKFLGIIICEMVIFALLFTTKLQAAEKPSVPKFSLTTINKGTGVKIVIEKTEGAEGYDIEIRRDNNYNEYSLNYGVLAEIKEDGTKIRTYTLNGLPKGEYKFRVNAYKLKNDGEFDKQTQAYSNYLSISIKDVKNKKRSEKTYDFSKVKQGDIITFGAYEQDDNVLNGKEDIEWIVLYKTKSKIMVISKMVLDWVAYHYNEKNGFMDITWENCTYREWLNGYFYKTAFTTNERKMIKRVTLKNKDNPDTGTEGGNDTQDKIFALSLDELVNKKYGYDAEYDKNDLVGEAYVTEFAKAQGGFNSDMMSSPTKEDGLLPAHWWLRTPGSRGNLVLDGWVNGLVSKPMFNSTFGSMFHRGLGVRPVMYISIK